ncbi:MAG: hypothetical protein Q9226_004917 [Calogaya cf. arnoldii]
MFKKKPCESHASSDDEQSTAFLDHSRGSSASSNGDDFKARKKPILQEAPTYREVFSRQSNINLLTYALLALHSVAYDQLLPVFMHHPPQHGRSSNPNVSLPFKFSGGFGLDSKQIGIIFTTYAVVGTMIQFLVFPPLVRYYGALNSLKVVSIIFPLVYLVTPFTALLPSPMMQQVVMFVIMMVKCFANMFAFPCTTILLTNSAVSLRVLGTLNGVATSVSAIGKSIGPALSGLMFETGSKKGWAILPWWVLAGFAILGAIPVWWLVEMEGFGASENIDDSEEGDEEPEVPRAEEGEATKPVKISSPENRPRNQVDDLTTENTGLLSNDGVPKASSRSTIGRR